MEEKKPLWNRLNDSGVLIIDEISMLSGEFFEMCDLVLRHIRRNSAPFGGMQVVCSGDFFQLPPVQREGNTYRYAFESEAWTRLNPIVCYLTEQYRHEGSEFLGILSAIRAEQHRAKGHRKHYALVYSQSRCGRDERRAFSKT